MQHKNWNTLDVLSVPVTPRHCSLPHYTYDDDGGGDGGGGGGIYE